MIGIAAGKNLCLGLQPAKSAGVNYTVTVALKIVSVRMAGFGETAAAGLLNSPRVFGEHALSLAFHPPASRQLLLSSSGDSRRDAGATKALLVLGVFPGQLHLG